MTVRPMTAEDVEDVAGLSGQLGYPATARQIAARLETLRSNPDADVFVAEAAPGRIAGWIHVQGHHLLESDPCAEIGGLVVDAAARRQGVGRALVSAAERWARKRGYAQVRVRSNVKREDARAFYQGLGFAITKSQHTYLKTVDGA